MPLYHLSPEMKKYLFILFFCHSCKVFAQAPLQKAWDKIYGGLGVENVLSVEIVNDNILLFGSSSSNNSFEKSEPSQGLQDYWLLKLDTSGSVIWNKTYGGNFEDDATRAIDGGWGTYLIGGSSKSAISGDKSFAGKGGYDYWIIRAFESTGTAFLNQDFGGSNDDVLEDFVTTNDDGVLIAGTSLSGNSGDKNSTCLGSSDFWIIKTDFYFQQLWQQRFGGTGADRLVKTARTSDGGFLLFGNSYSDAGFDKSANAYGGSDFWIIKTDSVGNKLWDKTFGGSNDESAGDILVMNDGSI